MMVDLLLLRLLVVLVWALVFVFEVQGGCPLAAAQLTVVVLTLVGVRRGG